MQLNTFVTQAGLAAVTRLLKVGVPTEANASEVCMRLPAVLSPVRHLGTTQLAGRAAAGGVVVA